ncbi:SRPBCC family protein [Alkalibacterium olivapovliticus]|uniref:Uncharacterized protein YndB with AHSA1/START domain n=1 Tax=Alkalibacterium olivapovliticus TaxID=99907 RepID=A0A2T0W0W8_9LACT|nr:SRPBCC domain-containing protein [Alkalibacterium olivapovliticus]PRY78652.1 uncharacterized protein YndB with AHSA1/START domain [Alkalibacterium olivapovliticus]
MKPDLSVHHHFPFSIEKVWTALTDSKTLSKWIWSNDFEPVIGHTFQFRAEPNDWWDGIVNCKVLEIEEPYKLSYTWHSAEEETIIVWRLEEQADGSTTLTLDQSGFSEETKVTKGAIQGAVYSWTEFCRKLETLLVTKNEQNGEKYE